MAGTGKNFDSLRPSSLEREPLFLALVISVALHLLAWGGYEAGQKFNFWQRLNSLHRAAKMVPPPQIAEEPVTFVTVDQPSTEAPKNAKYYSDKNSRASNPDANEDANVPQINGRQADVPKTEDAQQKQIAQLQPSPPPPQPKNPQHEQVQPGDLALIKQENSQP